MLCVSRPGPISFRGGLNPIFLGSQRTFNGVSSDDSLQILSKISTVKKTNTDHEKNNHRDFSDLIMPKIQNT